MHQVLKAILLPTMHSRPARNIFIIFLIKTGNGLKLFKSRVLQATAVSNGSTEIFYKFYFINEFST